MRKTLGGVMFTKQCIKYDYCFREAIDCLLELCDQVSVVDVGSDDGTLEWLRKEEKTNYRLIVTSVENSEWERNVSYGRERIAMYQNLALAFLDTDYYVLLQADEIIHEADFENIRMMIELDKEGFLIGRINLWGDANSVIDVPFQPCSTQVVRIAKTKYMSYGDGESISVPNPYRALSVDIFHYGFVRKKEVMKAKVENMQADVFQIEPDPKLYQSEVFDSTLWFTDEDLKPLTLHHPKYIKEWILTRP